MTETGMNVDHGALDTAAGDLIKAARDIEGRLDTLESELKPLQEQWTGQAKESYRQAKTTWDRAIAEMILLLSEVGGAVTTSNEEYKSADKRGAGRF